MNPGDLYQHFKGGFYKIVGAMPGNGLVEATDTVLGLAHDSEDPERLRVVARDEIGTYVLHHSVGNPFVVYEGADGKWWVRPLGNFIEEVDGVPRFRRL